VRNLVGENELDFVVWQQSQQLMINDDSADWGTEQPDPLGARKDLPVRSHIDENIGSWAVKTSEEMFDS
jgi:hypothetical protein